MFEKIHQMEDFRLIKPGTILIKYPTLGNPVEEIDLSDEHFFMVYEAKKVNKTRLELESLDETGRVSKIDKSFHGILSESIWWMRKEEDKSQKN